MTHDSLIPDRPLHITGFGLVSPLGHSAWSTFQALLAGRTLADRATDYPLQAARTDPVGFVRALGCCSLSQHAAGDPTIELAERVAREALCMAGIPETAWSHIPCYLGVSKGSMLAWERERVRLLGANTLKPPDDCIGSPTMLGPVGYLAMHLRKRLILGPLQPVMGACASSLIALHLARLNLLAAPPDQPQRVLILTAEAALLPLFIYSYKRLGVLPPLVPGAYAGLPLDAHRRGFMLSELAAAVVLERGPVAPTQSAASSTFPSVPGVGECQLPDLLSKGKHALQLVDTAIAGEGYDLMQPAPDMPALAHVVKQITKHRTIDVLHPHATGTPDNDAHELAVYQRMLVRHENAKVYACKGALGHGLGAAGLVSLVLACLCARTRRIPPMPWVNQPIDCRFPLHRSPQSIPANTTHAICAAGFGGHVAGAVIRHRA